MDTDGSFIVRDESDAIMSAAQFLVLGAKARTLLQGRSHVTAEDIQAVAAPVLRHRVLINYRAEAEGITTGKIIEQLLDHINPDA